MPDTKPSTPKLGKKLYHGTLLRKAQDVGSFKGTVKGGVYFPGPNKGETYTVEFYCDLDAKKSKSIFTPTVTAKDGRQVINPSQLEGIKSEPLIQLAEGPAQTSGTKSTKVKAKKLEPRVNMRDQEESIKDPTEDDD